MKTTTSDELFERAIRVIPGGVNSPVRAFGSVGGTPRFIVRGDGAMIFDEDGAAYVDLVQSWGPLPLGHARAEIVAAARGALQRGSSFGAPTRAEVLLAETIVDAVPSIEQVRLTSSGTEATMTAVRLARGATGRNKIVKFAGHYHGHSDALLVDAGSGVATLGIPGSPGVTPGAAQDTIVVPWNDPEALDAAIDQHGTDLAAILAEPVPANMNLVPPVEGFLAHLRERADSCGALLIFDEVISGFRLGRGGAQERYGVLPDLTCLGKAIGGGFPLAAVGGRRDIMEQLAPTGPIYHAGTLSGNPVAVSAGVAQLGLLTGVVFDWLERATIQIVEGLRTAFEDAGLTATVTRVGTLAGVVFAPKTPQNYEEARAADHDMYRRFFHAMLSRGVYLAPSGYEVMFTCTALDSESLDRIRWAAEEAAAEIA